jgi:glycine hydroxymethyltransferase
MTSRGLNGEDFATIVEFIDRAHYIAKQIHQVSGLKVADFKKWLEVNAESHPELQKLKKDVVDFSKQFPLPGVDY